MPSMINTNIASLNAQNNLGKSQSALATSLQRLSSGLRINSAKDDAAGLAISERFGSQIRGLNQAARNANDAISVSQTAEGALGTISDNLQRIRELSVQSANATNSSTDRSALNSEVTQLKAEIDRVANQTSFNGTKLIDGSFTAKVFQVGANAGETITVAGIQNATLAGLGSVTSASTQASVAVSGISVTTAMAAGSVTINGTDIGGLAAVGTSSERAAQVVDAINKVASTTNVNAYLDTTTNKIALTSNATITVGGTDDGTRSSFDGATGITAASSTVTGLTTMDISSYAGASLAIQQTDSALSQINSARANLGALQNRFSSTISNLQTAAENTSASRSRIQDTDFAAETASLTRAQILQQAGTAMLAQANALPNGVMSLLRG
jgi:flagellin